MTRKSIAAFAVYIGLAASGWIVQLMSPSSLPRREAEILVLAALVCGAGLAYMSGRREVRGWAVSPLFGGVLLFFVPSVLMEAVEGGVPQFTRAALLVLVPAAVLLISAAREGEGIDLLGLLAACLAGVGGAFLLLPADPALLLGRPLAGLALAAMIASIALGSYLAHAATRSRPLRASLLLLLGPSLVLLCLMMALERSPIVRPSPADAPGLLWGVMSTLLLVYLLREIAPIPFAARYVLVPLVTSLEGFASLRPPIGWRMLVGVALLGYGAVRLLVQGGRRADSSLSLL